MGKDFDLYPSPGEEYIRVMALFFGHLSGTVDESQCRLEVLEAELAPEVMLVYYLPGWELAVQFFEFLCRQGWGISSAGNAGFVG